MSLSNASITSDVDYLKIHSDALLSITTSAMGDPDFAFPTDPFADSGGEQGIVTITHSLGSVPLVRAFIDPAANGHWYSSDASIGFSGIDPNLLTLVGPNTLKLCVNSNYHKANIPVWYRIYKLTNQAMTSADRIDKIFQKSPPGFSINIGAASGSSNAVQSVTPIAHNQGEAIAWTMQFSQDGTNWYNDGNFIYGGPDTNSGPAGGPYSYYYYQRAYAEADDNNFYIRVEHNYPTTRTFYVRFALDYRV